MGNKHRYSTTALLQRTSVFFSHFSMHGLWHCIRFQTWQIFSESGTWLITGTVHPYNLNIKHADFQKHAAGEENEQSSFLCFEIVIEQDFS